MEKVDWKRFKKLAASWEETVAEFRQYASCPHTLAMAVAIGAVGGTFPLPGVAAQTTITLVMAHGASANKPVAQAVNVLTTPLLPFFMYVYARLGTAVMATAMGVAQWALETNLSGEGPGMTTLTEVGKDDSQPMWFYIMEVVMGAIGAWLALSPIVGGVAYALCRALHCALVHDRPQPH